MNQEVSRVLPHQHGNALPEGIETEIGKTENFRLIADVFRQVGDPTRVRIFWLLCHCEECVTNIAALLAMSGPAVSHHLRALKDARLLVARREGKEVYYRASDSRESLLLHQMIEQVMQIACPK